MTEDEAYLEFCRWRYSQTLGRPVCPDCGAGKPYLCTGIRKRRYQMICRECARHFTAKAGSLFQDSKLPFVTIMRAISFVQANPKCSSIALKKAIRVTSKAAYVMHKKLTASSEKEARKYVGYWQTGRKEA